MQTTPIPTTVSKIVPINVTPLTPINIVTPTR